MKPLNILWATPPLRAWGLSLALSLLLLTLLSGVIQIPRHISPLMVIVAAMLLFAFLVYLPNGKCGRQLGAELMYWVASGALFALSAAWLYALDGVKFTFPPEVVQALVMLGLGSHIAIRIFARPFEWWKQVRRRRLMWEIAHAQLRLVVLVMAVLFLILMVILSNNDFYTFQSLSEVLPNAVALFIMVAGFFGVATGLLLFVVMVPASVISFLTSQQITRRLEELMIATQSTRDSRTPAYVTVEGEDELAQLQTNFNVMMRRLEEAQQELQQERDTVRQLLTTRQRLFADVSHELRTPIAILRSHLEGWAEGTDSAKIAPLAREVLRLQTLVDDVFTVARADMNVLPYDIKSININTVVAHTAHAMQQQAWQARKVEIVAVTDPLEVIIKADEQRMEQVLYNLLHNAIRHTPPGGLIRVSVVATPANVTIAIEDTGNGIAAEDLPSIWERFYRTAKSRAEDSSGTGLGLALVKEMVERMGGTVAVQSALGRGSCFSLTFPLAGVPS